MILNNRSSTALHRENVSHFQYHILGRRPAAQLARQFHTYHLTMQHTNTMPSCHQARLVWTCGPVCLWCTEVVVKFMRYSWHMSSNAVQSSSANWHRRPHTVVGAHTDLGTLQFPRYVSHDVDGISPTNTNTQTSETTYTADNTRTQLENTLHNKT